jgi:hypothetical protein
MGAPLGFKTFATGDVLTAADTNGYLMQGIWTFASATARDAAVTSPQEGNTCYLKDTDVIQCYSGSAWVTKSGSSDTGKVLQVVYGVTTTETAVSSTTEVDTTLTASITPSSSSNKVLVLVNHSQNGGGNTGAWGTNVNLYRGATNVRSIAIRNGRFITNGTYSVPGMYLDSPATTSSTTYKLKFAQNTSETNTMYAQIAGYPSFITLLEIGG